MGLFRRIYAGKIVSKGLPEIKNHYVKIGNEEFKDETADIIIEAIHKKKRKLGFWYKGPVLYGTIYFSKEGIAELRLKRMGPRYPA